MKKESFCLLFLFISCFCFAQTSADPDLLEKAKRIHKKVITIDTHNDIEIENFTDEKNYTQDIDTQVNIPKMEKGGMDVSWMIVYTEQGPLTEEGYQKAYNNAMLKFIAIHKLVNELAPDKLALATTSEEVRKQVKEGKKVVMIGVENGYPIGTDIENVEKFYALGARYMSLAHQGHSQLSDSNSGEEKDEWQHHGLSELGKKVIVEMNRLGIMVDISHPSKEAIKQMLALTKAPVIASHSSARALCDNSRNLDDELLKLVKKNGGVVQAVAFAGYINAEKDKRYEEAASKVYEQQAEKLNFHVLPEDSIAALDQEAKTSYYDDFYKVRKQAAPGIAELKKKIGPVNVQDFVDHIDYLVDLIGIDHVGISSDFDGGGGIEGWEDASQSLNVTIELVKRGYTEEEIAKLWGENLLRVLDEVQAVARKLQKA
ncbi:MAG: dipeptidase [Salegentibacter sp.]